MATAQAMPMPMFVARCLEEIGLEGRCGLPVKDMFALVDDAGDVVYRKYAWKVLRSLGDQVKFHYMLRAADASADGERGATAARSRETGSSNGAGVSGVGGPRREKRRRKWSTTLVSVDEGNAEHGTRQRSERSAKPGDETGGEMTHQRRRRRRRVDADGNDAIDEEPHGGNEQQHDKEGDTMTEDTQAHVTSEETANGRTESQNEERQTRSRVADRSPDRSRSPSRSSGPRSRSPRSRSQELADEDASPEDAEQARRKWILRSPRGYDLGEELDVAGLSYEDSICETPEGLLGIVACEELRLKYLGVVDPSGIDVTSPQFDLLELIGRAREQGLNAAVVAETRLFGDARKLHYLLDLLIASVLVTKNIISADQRRFNILHLTRFASHFHPTMVSPTATLEKDSFPKEQLPTMIARILRARGERTCVFADIGRELGFGKRHQENLRKYFFHQMQIDANFPLELFMARCNTGSDTKGRKLWCVRLRSTGRSIKAHAEGNVAGSGPVIERGIMEQMFANIQERETEGATIPELRDVLGVPTFKLPYKLAQGLISSYSLGVEQVVLGKSTMYRMFAPGVVKSEREGPSSDAAAKRRCAELNRNRRPLSGNAVVADATADTETIYQPSTLKEATRGMVFASTAERRRQYIMERVGRDKIVSIHQLRTGLIEIERPRGKSLTDVGLIDYRSVRRIVDELEGTKAIVTVDITLPPKRVLEKSSKVVKCVALPGAQRDRGALRAFIDGYFEDQQRKFLENLGHDNDAFIVVSNRLQKKLGKTDPSVLLKDTENKEIVNYSATSYKLARVQLVALHKQCRRLGMYFGIMYRCKAFHLLMWDRVASLPGYRASNGAAIIDNVTPSMPSNETQVQSPKTPKLVFALKEILDLLTVHEYVQLVGVSEVLSEAEENKVRMAIARGDSWPALSTEIVEKIRGCEADRFSRLLRVLIELGLVQVVNDSSLDLISAMRRSTDDFDKVISQVAFATLSGGLFLLKERVQVVLKRGNKVLKQLPSKSSYVYAAGYSGTNRTEQTTGRIPLDFKLVSTVDVREFWKALKFLSIEGGRLGNGSHGSAHRNINLDAELVRAVPLRDHNLHALKVWVPRSTTNYSAISERAKAVAEAVDQEKKSSLKRKRYQAPNSSRASGRAEKVQRQALGQVFSSIYSGVEADEGSISSTAARWRRLDGWGGAKSRIRAAKWSTDDDVALIDLYIEKLSHQWFIDVPLALQKKDERVAFRSTALSRTKISWKVLGDKLKRTREDCMARVRELLTVPAIQARLENTKRAITRAKNPGGLFHEEQAVLSQPKLTALLCRALQIIFHERTSYYSVLADMLISSHWKEAEVKLVWRYLWLGSVITRTKVNEGKNQRQRGFCMHSHVYEAKSLQIPFYSIEFFSEAAEYASFLNQNIKEVELVGDEASADPAFEQEIEVNASSGQIAIDMTAMVMREAAYVPEFAPFPQAKSSSSSSKPSFSPTLQDSKRSLAIKGFAGHLSKRFAGASPDDFLKEIWSVRAKYGANVFVEESDGKQHVDIQLASTEAFSTCRDTGSRTLYRRSDSVVVEAARWLTDTLETVGRNGVTLAELNLRFQNDAHVSPKDVTVLDKAIESVLTKRWCYEVNGSDAVRLVAAAHASMWTVRPYRIGSDSTKDKVHFVFDQERPIVSRPWLHLDGSVNAKVAMLLKRRVVNIVMCSPGIPDHSIHRKMHRALTLQDTRSLLDELVEEDLLYARASRSNPRSRRPKSIFDLAKHTPHRLSLTPWTPGQLRSVDNDRDQLHYFPAVNCVELLGAAASDIDLVRSE